MNKIIIVFLVVVVIGAGVFGLTRKSSDNKASTAATSNTNSQTAANNTKTQPSQSQTQPSATSSVSIENFAFMPGDITVKKGTTVTWTNNDSTTHTVTEADSQTGPKSDDLTPGSKYTFTFDTAGTFHYKCSIHPDMLGTVTVTE